MVASDGCLPCSAREALCRKLWEQTSSSQTEPTMRESVTTGTIQRREVIRSFFQSSSSKFSWHLGRRCSKEVRLFALAKNEGLAQDSNFQSGLCLWLFFISIGPLVLCAFSPFPQERHQSPNRFEEAVRLELLLHSCGGNH